MRVSARQCCILIAVSVAVVAPSGALTVAERGKTADSVVVLPADATEANRTAARELVEGVKRLTGVALPVVSNACDSVAARRIVLCRDPSFPESSFRIEANGGELRITGADRGLCYGVFETLERFGDVEWFTEEVESFPRLDRFEVPDGFCETQRPAIPIRDTNWSCARTSAARAAHLRLNGTHVQRCRMEPYGDIAVLWAYRLHHCHTFKNLVPVKEYGETHPEYYAIDKDGKRYLQDIHGPNPCLTNPDVKRIVVEKVLASVRANPDTRYFGVGQNDTRMWCRCPACNAINEREGTDAGTLIELVNEVARAVAGVRTNAFVTTLAYHMTRTPPRTLKLEPNVMIVLCTTECDFSAPLKGNPNADTQRFLREFKRWRELASELYIYDYVMNFRLAGHAMPNVRAFQENVKFFRDNGVLYQFAEGGPAAGWFAELKCYIESKCLWNPDRDMNPFIDRFLSAYYGPAAKKARAVLDLFETFPRDRAKYPMPYYDDILSPAFPNELFEQAAGLWKEAVSLVPAEPFASRVAAEALKTDFTRVARYVSKRSVPIDPQSAYHAEMKAAATRILDYEASHPEVGIGWFWYKYVQPEVYVLVGRKPPAKDAKKFGEL